MRHHLVVAHPSKTSLCHAIADEIAGTLTGINQIVDIFDLYEYSLPHLTKVELDDYPHIFRHGSNTAFVKSLRESTALIYIYPVWMYNVPSILSAYFDRAWCPESTFTFSPNGPVSLMQHITKMTIVATHGMSKARVAASTDVSVPFFYHGIGSLLPSTRIITRFDIYDLDHSDQARVAAEISRIKNHFTR
jgi:putative NADPH-quinone reductase